jgi:hypothetical protein
MSSHLTEEDLVLHYYGELGAPDEAQATAHLSSCGACHDSYRRLQRVLAVVDEHARIAPALPANFERTVWARLEPNLRPAHGGWLSWLVPSPQRLAWAAAIVVLVGAGFVAGRLVPPASAPAPDVAGVSASPSDIRERILLVDLSDHLEQSQMVLVELVSADDRGPGTMAGERTRAEQLVAANRLYRQTAMSTGDSGIADLLDDLERVLVDVAASPDNLSSEELGDLRRRIESRSLLFKVRVVSSEVRQRQRSMIQERAGQRSSL